MPNFVILNKKLNKNYKTRLLKRDFHNFKDTNVIKEIKSINFTMIDNPVNDIDDKCDFFQSKIIDTINKHAPMKPLSRKRQKQYRKPWITN